MMYQVSIIFYVWTTARIVFVQSCLISHVAQEINIFVKIKQVSRFIVIDRVS